MILLASVLAPAGARAQDPPKQGPTPGHATLAEARFRDNCLDDHEKAEALYRKALDAGLTRLEEAEAQFGIGRSRLLSGRQDPGLATMEKLADKAGDASLAPWPARARQVLDRVSGGEPPFPTRPRGDGVFSLNVAGKPIDAVLRDLVAKTKVGVVFDDSAQTHATVSVSLEDLPFEDLMNKVAGTGRWRRVGDSIVVGAIAANGEAFERRFSYDGLKKPEERATAGLLATRRVSVNFPTTSLAVAIEKLNEVSGGVKIEASSAVTEAKQPSVRALLKDERLDKTLDLIAVPVGLTWAIEGSRVVLYPRKAESGE
jgi:hypothetical protein